MPRALSSAVSGMLNQQLVLDTTANNLANVNTSGFKASRVSFSNTLIQTVFAGSAPGGSIGGRNPLQVGLGMTSSSVDLDMRQGTIESTGRTFDLAIQGEGFFQVTDGTNSRYTRVGNFNFDSSDNLVDLGSGFKVVGNLYNRTPNPDGSQSITDVDVPIQVDRTTAFPPKQTDAIVFQGNLSSTSDALQGTALQSVFPLIDSTSGDVATENTSLSDLSIFKNVAGVSGTPLTMHMFGTKPDGEAYGYSFDIYPWNTSASTGAQGTVGELLAGINAGLTQGTQRFGAARLDNGNLQINSTGTGDGFSVFLGEQNPFAGAPVAIGAPLTANTAYAGVSVTGAQHVILPAETGLLNATFTIPASDYTAQAGAVLRVSMLVNGVERGSINIPAADYSLPGAQLTFSSSFPHVVAGDTVSYNFAGGLNLGGNIAASTSIVADSDPGNLTADADADGFPDMFQEGSTTDANAWVYQDSTNATFDWYRSRTVPDLVTSSIQVYDAQGGKHTVDTRLFRTGTRADPQTGARTNSWDMIVGVNPNEGTIINNVVAGIEFDQQGRVTGGVGTSVHSTTYSDSGYVGNPGAGTIQIDWNTTGPTNPATMQLDFGTPNSVDGLTGFGSATTANAVSQDGYSDGTLASLSVSSEGDVVGLYTNGVSLKLAQLSLTTFRNPGGLSQIGTNMFAESANSGSATRRTAGTASGFITAGALEGGNVDIATEFTRIITAQRGFQVNAKIIQTADSMLEELANLIR